MAITKQKDGRWKVDVRVSPVKRFRKTFKTKGEAQRFELHVQGKAEQSKEWAVKGPDRRRLSELVGLWYDLHGHMLKDGERRRAKLDALAIRLGDPVAATLRPQVYAHDRRVRNEGGTSPKTLNNELGYLRAVYNELKGLGEVLYANPLELVKPFRIEERELSWLDDGEVDQLLDAIRSGCDNPHVLPIVLICLATGARWSEAEGLRPSRLRDCTVTYAQTKSSRVRSIPVSADLDAFIREHWKQHGQFTPAITSFRRALDRSGIELPKGQASHALRHTFASRFMQKGGNILTLQKILGHSSLAMTMRYAHLAPEHLVEAVRLNPLAGRAIFGQTSTLESKNP
ncbi:tyrosine-type recombinase/integrase [Pseudomonas nicosulfuronedens]|uniref:phage integrase n=1 Tax=Pseudomonas nicosulfuronedens TaxID=2571105 RepID=UPI0024474804|nr:tyrosine-type recombinase/integrase [Pseudomonas nicosulfuronedens]MDH1008308.1 tyrosine-type recombinase/integrase [Pseudomonas nicosulfuronedens]MDH1979266.1 tyrosine-type recombinase/integrase [Pseudomonas nicosulfuronedens]MDH2027286.1 tyrosine-type recombinase/integrase [Pseudomonas nicosulfuronedens]